jgi:nucleotide-binding universal stress UspA family protein
VVVGIVLGRPAGRGQEPLRDGALDEFTEPLALERRPVSEEVAGLFGVSPVQVLPGDGDLPVRGGSRDLLEGGGGGLEQRRRGPELRAVDGVGGPAVALGGGLVGLVSAVESRRSLAVGDDLVEAGVLCGVVEGCFQVPCDGDALDATAGGPPRLVGDSVADGARHEVCDAVTDPPLLVGLERVPVRTGVGQHSPGGACVGVARVLVVTLGQRGHRPVAVSTVLGTHVSAEDRTDTRVRIPGRLARPRHDPLRPATEHNPERTRSATDDIYKRRRSTSSMTVLVAYDGSRPAQNAIEHALTKYPDEEIVLLRVVEASTGSLAAGVDMVQEWIKTERDEAAADISETVEELIDNSGVEFRVETAVGQPAREIVEFAEKNDIDTVVVGSHGREGVSRVFLGSVAEKVVRRAPMTVTVVR